MQKNITLLGRINLTIDNLVNECGYTPNKHSNKSNDTFKNIIKELIHKEYFTTDCDIDNIWNNQMFTLKLSDKKDIFSAQSNFVLLTIEEFDKIVKNETKVNKAVVLATYIYIKQFITIDNDENGYFSKIAYPSKYGMQKKLGISSKTTIENAIKDLINLKMLYEYVGGFYEDENGEFAPVNNVFALDEKELKYAEKELCNYYKVDKIYKKGEFDKDKLKYPERNKNN